MSSDDDKDWLVTTDFKNGKDYLVDIYAFLEIDREADAETIKKAYRERSQIYHPDKYQHLAPTFRIQTEQIFQNLQWAFETLSDPVKRAAYDKQLAEWKGPISTSGNWVYDPRWHSRITPIDEEFKQKFLPQITGYNPETHGLLEKLVAASPDDPELAKALDNSYGAQDSMLAVEEELRWKQAGIEEHSPEYRPNAGYLEEVRQQIAGTKETLETRAKENAKEHMLLAQSGQLKLLSAGGEDQTQALLADPDLEAKLVEAEIQRFSAAAEKIEEVAQRREAVIEKRFANLRGEYRPLQNKFYHRVIIGCGGEGHRMWRAVTFDRDFSVCREDNSISEEEMQKLTDDGEAIKMIEKGINVLFFDLRQGLDYWAQLEEALQRHSENLQKQEAKKWYNRIRKIFRR